MKSTILRIQGILELSVILFIIGIIIQSPVLIMIGGILMLINDIIGMAVGALNPTFPILLAIVLALIIKPWYVGIFWSMAIFNVISIPTALMKIFRTKSF